MSASTPAWDDLRLFLEVARGGTLAAAATVVGVNASTVHRRLAQLEQDMGTVLFDRSPRGYSLTACGQDLLEHAVAMEEEVLALGRRVSGRDQKLSGIVRVTTVDDLALTVLASIFREFREAHPQVELDVDIHSQRADLSRRQADVAIRPGTRPTDGNVVARNVCRVGVALYGSRTYLEQHGRPQSLEDLARYTIVRGDDRMASFAMERFIDRHVGPSSIGLRSNSMLARLAAVREGMGLGFLPCLTADQETKLVRLEPVRDELSADLWLVVHVDLRRNARVRAFVDFVHKGLLDVRAELEGSSEQSATGTPFLL